MMVVAMIKTKASVVVTVPSQLLRTIRLPGRHTFVRGVANTLTNAIEREQLEGTLRQAEQRYKTLLENFPGGGVFLFDDDLRYLIARGEGLSAFGLTPADVEGKTLAEVFPPAVVERQKPTTARRGGI